MLAPVGLLVFAIGLGIFAWLSQGSLPYVPVMELAVIVAAGALILLLSAAFRRGAPRGKGREPVAVLDGSNIMYWAGDGPDITTVRRVVAAVRAAGYKPVIWFDANAGYLIEDRYAGPVRFGRLLSLPAKDVFVAGKGEPADPQIIAAARQARGLIVSNDRYRDWQAQSGAAFGTMLVKGEVGPQGVTLHWPAAGGGAGRRSSVKTGSGKAASRTRKSA